MPVNPDFRDLFRALNGEGAEYLLVGGYALAVHAAPRFTKDLDVWVNATRENAPRVLAALRAFGAPLGGLGEDDLVSPGIVFQMGLPPNRIDLLTSIDGVAFKDAWPSRLVTEYGGEPLPVIGKAQLIANKRASARPQDLVDVQTLELAGDPTR
jgi:hypothetical protein